MTSTSALCAAKKPNDAIRNLKLYLLASPQANDTAAVKKKIAGLEYELEKLAKEQSQKKDDIRWASTLEGQWEGVPDHPTLDLRSMGKGVLKRRGQRVAITSSGNRVKGVLKGEPVIDSNTWKRWSGKLDCIRNGQRCRGGRWSSSTSAVARRHSSAPGNSEI